MKWTPIQKSSKFYKSDLYECSYQNVTIYSVNYKVLLIWQTGIKTFYLYYGRLPTIYEAVKYLLLPLLKKHNIN